MRREYELIARDFVLQIDAPDLAMERAVVFQDKSIAEFQKIAETHAAALNDGGDPPRTDPDALLLGQLGRAAPARHPAVGRAALLYQHEYAALKTAKLPPDLVLLPGDIVRPGRIGLGDRIEVG